MYKLTDRCSRLSDFLFWFFSSETSTQLLDLRPQTSWRRLDSRPADAQTLDKVKRASPWYISMNKVFFRSAVLFAASYCKLRTQVAFAAAWRGTKRKQCAIHYFSSTRDGQASPCPFRTLGLSEKSLYIDVKKKFLKLALQVHPDVVRTSSSPNGNGTSEEDGEGTREEKKASIEKFIRLRSAFEAIIEAEDGSAILREDFHSLPTGGQVRSMSEANFEQWFHKETGNRVPYNYDAVVSRHICPAILREVARVTENMTQSGLDKGGYWQMAFELKERVKNGDMPPLRIPEGQSSEASRSRKRRRRRRR